jgi:hypothetical protein
MMTCLHNRRLVLYVLYETRGFNCRSACDLCDVIVCATFYFDLYLCLRTNLDSLSMMTCIHNCMVVRGEVMYETKGLDCR